MMVKLNWIVLYDLVFLLGFTDGTTSQCPRAHGQFEYAQDCGSYVQCDNGVPTVMSCQPELLFNPSNSYCDWPEKVDCGSRPRRNYGDSGGGDNDNPDEEVCPNSWVKIHRGCYKFGLSAASWDDALAECKKQNGDLLSLQSEKERAEMEKHFKTTSLTEKQWWVGLKRNPTGWKWLDGVDVNTQINLWFSNAKKDNPKNECGMLDVTKALKISSDRCTSEWQYICELHSITKRPSFNHTSPVTPSRGATIFDDTVDKGVVDHAAEDGNILGVQKMPGQKINVTGTTATVVTARWCLS